VFMNTVHAKARFSFKADQNLGSVIELIRVSKRYGSLSALSGISTEIEQGQVVSLLGPNGSGKSTLLKLVALQSSPTSGRLELFGDYPATPDTRRRIGYLAHESFLYGELTVIENLKFYHSMFSPDQEFGLDALDEVIESLRIGKRLLSKVKSLSHGFRKRADIARALVHKPKLLVLDEPFSGLDPQTTRLLLDYLANKDPDRTILLSSQDLALVQSFCDRAILLEDGRMIGQSTFR